MNYNLWLTCYANDLDAFVPEVWAQESLMILESNMVAANLVHRDFENEIKNFGDVVNTRQPATFTAVRKLETDDVTLQDATATNVAVTLNQHPHTSFIIHDGEESKGFKSLVTEYLQPAVLSLAEYIDQVVCGQVYQFLTNRVGKIGTAATDTTVIALREKMNALKVPMTGRNVLISPSVEGNLLDVADFVNANTVGDNGTALREGHLGRKYGIDFYMDQNIPSITPASTASVTAAINLSAGYAAGSTALVIDGISGGYTLLVGDWITIAGDMTPHRVTVTNGSTTLTVTPALDSAVVNDAVVTIYRSGAVNLSAGYDAAWTKAMVVNTFPVAPKSGQLISGGATVAYYRAMGTPTTTSLTVERPLDYTCANTAVLGVGPAGEYCFGFHRNALALVVRPLAAPMSGLAKSFVANYNGLSVRVTITYNGTSQGHLVTVDLLCGVKVLNTNLGCVMLA